MIIEDPESKAQAACIYFSLSIDSPFEKLRRAQAVEFESEFDMIEQEGELGREGQELKNRLQHL